MKDMNSIKNLGVVISGGGGGKREHARCSLFEERA